MSKIALYVIEPGKKKKGYWGVFFALGFVACAISNCTAKYPITLWIQGILHPRTSVSILWLMHQGAAAEGKKGKSEKETCWLHILGSLTASLPCCCRTCRTTAPSLRNVQWLGTEEFWRTADVAGRSTAQTSCFGNQHSSALLSFFCLFYSQIEHCKDILSHVETWHLLNRLSSLLLAQKDVFQKEKNKSQKSKTSYIIIFFVN